MGDRRAVNEARQESEEAVEEYGLSVAWSDENNGYIASTPEFPGVSVVGETIEEAVTEWAGVLKATISVYEEEGWDLPAPRKISDYSGRTNLRMGQELHYQLALEADKSKKSLNSIIVELIAKGLGMARA